MKVKLLLLLPIFLYSCGLNKPQEGKIFKVQTYTVGADTLSKMLSFPGRVKASDEVNLSFKVSGVLQTVNVKEGSKIEKGQLLAQIDPKDYKLELSASEAQYKQLLAESQRVVKLYKDSVVSANDYDKSRYGLDQIKAKLEYSKNQIKDCDLYSPFDGFVSKVLYEASSTVGSGMPVLTIVSDGDPEVEIDIPASIYVKRNQIKECYADFSYADLKNKVRMRILSYSPTANANQMYTVTLAIDQTLKQLPTPGMIAMVDITFKNENQSTLTSLPINAVFEQDGKSYIWMLAADSTVHKQEVVLSSVKSNGTVIISGDLPVGLNVVTAGVNKLVEGQKVEIMHKASKTNVGGLL